MQNFIKGSALKACFTLLSLSLLSSSVFALGENRISYLDSVSTNYLYEQPESSIMNSQAPEAQGIEASLMLDSRPNITNKKTSITLSLRDSDVKQVLRMLADKAGVNIVFDESVSGKVTLDLKNVDLNDAFFVVFKTMKYAYTLENNTLTVMSADTFKTAGYTRQNMTVIPVKYVNADMVAEFLNENLFSSNIFGLSSTPIVTSNPRTNQIMVFGSNADVVAIKRVLPVLDTKPLVNNFVVKHTTPKEMAELICDSLFYKSGSDSDTKADEPSDELEKEEMLLGAGAVACRDNAEESKSETGLAAFKGNPLTVSYFPDLGLVSTYGGSVEQANMIRDFIALHDKKQLMAYVELSVVELNETGSKEFANEWNLWTPFISLTFTPSDGLSTSSTNPFFIFGDKMPTTVLRQTTTDDGKGNTSSSTVEDRVEIPKSNNKALVYKLRYLIENGNGRVLTNPKIMVTNGRKATIDLTSDYVKSVTSQVLQSSSSITSATQKTYNIGSDEGLKIEIVPFISPDGYVSMNISPEFATIKQQVYSANDQGVSELAATLLQRRDLELRNIRIKDGETLVLAGLIRESEQQTVQKMPILSDLPFIGPFFRGNSNAKAREEMVIVVTPHIVKDGDGANKGDYNL